MRRLDRLWGSSESRGSLSWPDYVDLWTRLGFNGVEYVVPSGNVAELTALQGAGNPIVAACIAVRSLVFSEVRFGWQRWTAGQPGELFGTPNLELLERPWPTATTRDLLARMEVDASLYGNSFWTNVGGELVRLDPARTMVVSADVVRNGVPVGQRLVAYSVHGDSDQDVTVYEPDEVAHYAPLPSSTMPFTGVSWLSAVLPDVTADRQLTQFKTSFVANAATPGLAVTYPAGVTEAQVKQVKEAIDAGHSGAGQSFKTLHIGGGADVNVVGSTLDQVNLKAVQGAGETRIAAAAGCRR